MAFQIVQKLFLALVGDGVSSVFTFPFNALLPTSADQHVENQVLPVSAKLYDNTAPQSGVASVVGSNLVLTFSAPWALNQTATVQVDLYFDSGTTNPAGGSNTDSAGSPSTVNPTQIAGVDDSGIVRQVITTEHGAIVTVDEDTAVGANHFAVTTGQTHVSVTSLQPLISVRPQAGAGAITFFLTGLDIYSAPGVAMWQLVKNGSLTGSSFANVPNSNAQQDTSATSLSGGTVVDSGYTSTGNRMNVYKLTFSVGDTYTLVLSTDINGKNTHGTGALRWSEQIQPL